MAWIAEEVNNCRKRRRKSGWVFISGWGASSDAIICGRIVVLGCVTLP